MLDGVAALESPKGMVRALSIIHDKSFRVRYSDFVAQRMSRWAASQCLQRLVELGILVPSIASRRMGSERWYVSTARGRPLVEAGAGLFRTMQRLEGTIEPGRLLALPFGSLSIVALAVGQGAVARNQICRDVGVCRDSAARALRRLHEAGLLRVRIQGSGGFPPSIPYEPTGKGYRLGRDLARFGARYGSLPSGHQSFATPRRKGRPRARQADLLDFSPTENRQEPLPRGQTSGRGG